MMELGKAPRELLGLAALLRARLSALELALTLYEEEASPTNPKKTSPTSIAYKPKRKYTRKAVVPKRKRRTKAEMLAATAHL